MKHQQMVELNRVHSKRMILVKKEQIVQKDWKDAFDEWYQSIKCIDECFSILFPSVLSYSHSNRIDDRSSADRSSVAYDAPRVLTPMEGSNVAVAAVEEVESDESLADHYDDDDDGDAQMSPYHQDESGVEWVEEDDDDAHRDGHRDEDRDDDNHNQKRKVDEFNAHDLDHHHLSMQSEGASVHAYNPEEEDDEFDDGSMPTGAVPYSLVSIMLSS